jgi:hypothetical protein
MLLSDHTEVLNDTVYPDDYNYFEPSLPVIVNQLYWPPMRIWAWAARGCCPLHTAIALKPPSSQDAVGATHSTTPNRSSGVYDI